MPHTERGHGLPPAKLVYRPAGSAGEGRVDGHTIYTAHGTVIPERAGIGFSIWTMMPVRHGRGRSLAGQDLTARWRRFRLHGLDA